MSPLLFDLCLKIWIMKSVSNSMFTTPKRQLFFFLSLGSGYRLAKFLAKLKLTLE